jgi:hypothetical protein
MIIEAQKSILWSDKRWQEQSLSITTKATSSFRSTTGKTALTATTARKPSLPSQHPPHQHVLPPCPKRPVQCPQQPTIRIVEHGPLLSITAYGSKNAGNPTSKRVCSDSEIRNTTNLRYL